MSDDSFEVIKQFMAGRMDNEQLVKRDAQYIASQGIMSEEAAAHLVKILAGTSDSFFIPTIRYAIELTQYGWEMEAVVMFVHSFKLAIGIVSLQRIGSAKRMRGSGMDNRLKIKYDDPYTRAKADMERGIIAGRDKSPLLDLVFVLCSDNPELFAIFVARRLIHWWKLPETQEAIRRLQELQRLLASADDEEG